MSARIAPDPIGGSLQTVADHRRRGRRDGGNRIPEVLHQNTGEQSGAEAGEASRAPLAPAPAPSAAAFTAALLSGPLRQTPASPRELKLQFGTPELPAHGSLALHDRLV